jgi:diguanylate cyclase (GGDEF)-like protein
MKPSLTDRFDIGKVAFEPKLPAERTLDLHRELSNGGASPSIVKILLVEDNPIDAMRVRQMLSRVRAFEARVESVATLEVAVERVTQGTFDLLLVDLHLPDSEGLDTYSSLAAAAPVLPIVVLSAYADEAVGVQAVQLGAQDALIKSHLSAEGLGRSLRCALERHRLITSLRGLSLTDELTGLLNRRGFSTLAAGHLRLGARTGSRFLLFFGDMDGLKQINDTFGHHNGDVAIVRLANVLRSTFRQSDLLARFAGDEFAMLALDSSGDEGRTVRRRLDQNLARENEREGFAYQLSVSVGVVPFEARADVMLPDVMELADRALYAEKRMRA